MFSKDYKSHTVPARRDCRTTLGTRRHTSGFVALKRYSAMMYIDRTRRLLLPSSAHAPHSWDM